MILHAGHTCRGSLLYAVNVQVFVGKDSVRETGGVFGPYKKYLTIQPISGLIASNWSEIFTMPKFLQSKFHLCFQSIGTPAGRGILLCQRGGDASHNG
jgi:hypothetical protein